MPNDARSRLAGGFVFSAETIAGRFVLFTAFGFHAPTRYRNKVPDTFNRTGWVNGTVGFTGDRFRGFIERNVSGELLDT